MRTETLIDQISLQINKTPDALAIKCEEVELTYKQLGNLMNKFACYLTKTIKPIDTIIPIYASRGPNSIVAMLAIWKIGKAFSIIDKSTPPERAQLIFDKLESSLIIDDDFIVQALAGNEVENPGDLDENFSNVEIKLDDIASIIWTSGTTGEPKGVVISHKNYRDTISYVYEALGSHITMINIASFAFIAGQIITFAPLTGGYSTHLILSNRITDIKYLISYISANNIEASFFPPQLGVIFLTHADGLLKEVILASDKASNVYSEKSRVTNWYGASETSGLAAYFALDKSYETTPIGKPFHLANIYLVDDKGNLVEDGQTGEICVSGNIAQGYYKNEALTNEKFTTNPFSKSEDDKKLYHTGDLAYKNEDGNIVYVQRKDYMVNIHGQRVEPGEVEKALTKIAGIKAAAVGGFRADEKTSISNDVQLYAGYVSDEELNALGIQRELAKYLPDYMIPVILQKIEKIPLTSGGKLDRKNFIPDNVLNLYESKNNPSDDTSEQADNLPLGATGNKILDIAKRILGNENIDCNSNLIALGLHSLTAMQLSSRINNELQLSISIQDILRGPTVAQISQNAKSDAQALSKYEKQEYYPLKTNQHGLYLYMIQNPESTAYNIPLLVKFSPSVNVEKIKDAVTKTINSFPYLKSTIVEKDGKLLLKRNDEIEVQVDIYNDTVDSPGEKGFVKESLVKPFELHDSNLYKVSIHKTDTAIYLFIDINHLVFDGGSADIFFTRLADFYNNPDAKFGVDNSAFDANIEEEKLLLDELHQKKLTDLYDSKLSKIDSPTVLTQSTFSENNLEKPNSEFSFKINKAKLDLVARNNGVTTNDVVLFVYLCALKMFNGSDDILLSLEVNTRRDSYANSVGMFVATVPVLFSIDEGIELSNFVKNLHTYLLEVEENYQYTLTDMQQKYGFIPQLSYNYRGTLFDRNTLANNIDDVVDLIDLFDTWNDVKTPFILHIDDNNNEYLVTLEFDNNMFDETTIESFANLIKDIANDIEEYI